MADPTRAQQVAVEVAKINADLEAYCRTLTHAEALHCMEHLGATTSHFATSALVAHCVPHDRFRARVHLASYTVGLLARRAARTHASRPGGRPSYNHDDCSCFLGMERFLAELQRRIDHLGQVPPA